MAGYNKLILFNNKIKKTMVQKLPVFPCLTKRMEPGIREDLKQRYIKLKRSSIKTVWIVVCGSEFLDIDLKKWFSKINFGKLGRKLGKTIVIKIVLKIIKRRMIITRFTLVLSYFTIIHFGLVLIPILESRRWRSQTYNILTSTPWYVQRVECSDIRITYIQMLHSFTSGVYRWLNDMSDLPWVVLDILLFGEIIPTCPKHEYKLFDTTLKPILSGADLNAIKMMGKTPADYQYYYDDYDALPEYMQKMIESFDEIDYFEDIY